MAYLARSAASTMIQNHQIIIHKLPLAKAVNLGNTQMNIVYHMGKVARLHSSHFQALHSSIAILYSTSHTVRTQPPAHTRSDPDMGHSAKDLTTTNKVMVGLKCSPLCRFQDKGIHIPAHWKCLQNHQETVQSIGRHFTGLYFHLNLIPVPLGDHPWAS